MKQVLTSEAFEAFIHGSIFDKAAFCLGEKQGMLVNDECSSWYNKVPLTFNTAEKTKRENVNFVHLLSSSSFFFFCHA